MKYSALGIEGCFLIEHDVFPDNRGLFREWFKVSANEELGIKFDVAQANFSISKQGVIRGLHYSTANSGQKKLITSVHGSVNDVLIDIRIGSPTFLNQVCIELNCDSGKTVLIDSGVAHGFSVLSESAAVAYLTSSEYSPELERGINPHDCELSVNWNIPSGVHEIISQADASSITLAEARNAHALPNFSAVGR
jgi:dTDP-4-dehydrorhamnose 3,5-epimerase